MNEWHSGGKAGVQLRAVPALVSRLRREGIPAEPGTSLSASMAMIPWVRRSFAGFIVGLWHGGHLYWFATYAGARSESLDLTDQEVWWVLQDRYHRLEMRAVRAEGGLPQAPTTVEMGRRIAETLNAKVEVGLYTLERRGRRPLFQGTGRHAGLEAVGDLAQLSARASSTVAPNEWPPGSARTKT